MTDDYSKPLESKANKRQSLLLPKGTLVAASQLRAPVNHASLGRQRPMSMFGLDTNSAKELANMNSTLGARTRAETNIRPSLRKPTAVEDYAVGNGIPEPGRPRPMSGIARSQSLRKPLTRTQSGPGAANPANKPLPKLVEHTTSDSWSSRGTALRSPVDGPETIGRSKLPTGGLHRSASTASRPTRSNSALPTPLGPSHHASTSLAPPRPTSMLAPNRPAFSTLQQHYSPRKNTAPKPPSSAIMHPAPVETASSKTMELQFLQTYLMQLSLQHMSFDGNLAEWCHATRQNMRHKFDEMVARADVVQGKEREIRRICNIQALQSWGGGPDAGLGENIQVLAGLIQELTVLCANGGRVRAIIDVFGVWVDLVEELWIRRRSGERNSVEFIDSLGEGWRSEVVNLSRRLTGLVGMLDGLEKAEEDSTVADVMRHIEDWLKGAIDELNAVHDIEKTVMEREKDWVDQQLGIAEGNVEAGTADARDNDLRLETF